MTISDRELVAYRLQRASESIEDASILAGAGRWNPRVNRLYYACFYAVSALLASEGLSSSRHTGVRTLFNQHFVHAGKIDKETAKVFHDMFERRQEGDYVDFVRFDASQVQVWLPQVREFVRRVADYLATELS
ncbi:MAG: HEPN domain-containing protein [Phycisphaerae bacterium]|nr:HEPN domain-containing protein [Phycisphaerae bacterium]